MFGKLGDMAGMMKKAQELQKNMAAAKDELAQTEVKGQSNCGNIEVVMTCDMVVRRVTVKQECFDTHDSEIIQDLVMTAVNSAITAAKTKTADRMSELTGGLDIPGL